MQTSYGVVRSWDAAQVERWLGELGFEQDVLDCLRSFGVDGPRLLRLDDNILYSYGVVRLGDRKRLLRRIQRINNTCFFLDLDPRTWTSEDVATWLKMCGLAEYSVLFQLSGITGRQLLALDEESLRDVGVAKWGHRKQILRRAGEARQSSRRRLRGRPVVAQWSERDVCDWLKLIQLRDYRQLFVDHRIDGRRLAGLTDALLLELGVTALGHRKRILKEVRAANAVTSVASSTSKAKASRKKSVEQRPQQASDCTRALVEEVSAREPELKM